MKRFLHIFREFALAKRMGSAQGVHSAESFGSILNRERDRTDRTGREFSLVVFESGSEESNRESARYLVPILQRRVRTTDEIGWLDGERLGVALPHTPADGAWAFVEKVRSAIGDGLRIPECMVYSYPTWWVDSAGTDASKEAGGGASESFSAIGGSAGGRRSNVALMVRARPVEDLESQFLRRIPAWKRAIDVVGSLVGLILLLPLFLLVAAFIKLVSPGPVFFRQERVGYLGKRFSLWKFRTMHLHADTRRHQQYLSDLINNEKSMIKLDDRNDARIIPFGTIFRKTGIDELPQLFNVLRGEMSLVGPRPCLAYEASEFLPWHMRRFDTVPGLTGLWQVSGKNRTTFKEMMRLDIAYAKKRAFLLDAKIFLKTIPAVVRQVADRPVHAPAGAPVHAPAGAKDWSVALRIAAVLQTALTLGKIHK